MVLLYLLLQNRWLFRPDHYACSLKTAAPLCSSHDRESSKSYSSSNYMPKAKPQAQGDRRQALFSNNIFLCPPWPCSYHHHHHHIATFASLYCTRRLHLATFPSNSMRSLFKSSSVLPHTVSHCHLESMSQWLIFKTFVSFRLSFIITETYADED